jgi:hypothetical protein
MAKTAVKTARETSQDEVSWSARRALEKAGELVKSAKPRDEILSWLSFASLLDPDGEVGEHARLQMRQMFTARP